MAWVRTVAFALLELNASPAKPQIRGNSDLTDLNPRFSVGSQFGPTMSYGPGGNGAHCEEKSVDFTPHQRFC